MDSKNEKKNNSSLRPFDTLPTEIKERFFLMLDLTSIIKSTKVCKNWKEIIENNSFWQRKYESIFAEKSPVEATTKVLKQEIFTELSSKYQSLRIPSIYSFKPSNSQPLWAYLTLQVLIASTSEEKHYSLTEQLMNAKMQPAKTLAKLTKVYKAKELSPNFSKYPHSNTVHYDYLNVAYELLEKKADGSLLHDNIEYALAAQLVLVDLSDHQVLNKLFSMKKDIDRFRKANHPTKIPVMLIGILPPEKSDSTRKIHRKTMFDFALENQFDKYTEWEPKEETRNDFLLTINEVLIRESGTYEILTKAYSIPTKIPAELSIESDDIEKKCHYPSCLPM